MTRTQACPNHGRGPRPDAARAGPRTGTGAGAAERSARLVAPACGGRARLANGGGACADRFWKISRAATEFLTAAATNPDFFFVGGSSGTYKFMNRISAGFSGPDAAPTAMASSFAPVDGVTSGIVIDTRTAGMTGSMATANIYFGTAGVSATTQSTIVQLAQAF